MCISKCIYHVGVVLPLDIANIDTDSILPKQFLKTITRSNFKEYLFFNWRFTKDIKKTLNPKFILNKKPYKPSSILLSRRNFGCGSSREHAVWALIDYGFRVIIASSFSDIFYKNSFNNHLLLITLSETEIHALFQEINSQKKGISFTIDLHNTTLYTTEKKYLFKINSLHKHFILNNLDTIELTLKKQAIIQQYESKQPLYLK